MSDYFNLSGKTILVTGAAGILGRQHVDALVSAGATVVATDVDEKSISQICTQINSKYNVELATPRYMDVTNRENIISVIEEYERIDILINNAAKDFKVEGTGELSKEGRFETMSYTRWKSDMEVGLGGCFLCSQAVANKMLSTGGGNIINIASDLSVIAPDQRIYRKEGLEAHEQNVKPVTYTVSKSAVVGLTKYMATYFADKNIRVNSLSPAGIYNEDMPQDFVDKLTSLIPMGRMANPGEYGGAIVFLCSDASEYMTGVNLVIDGGENRMVNETKLKMNFVTKGWGWERWIVNCNEYCGKLLYFNEGKRCSWHYHKLKDEVFYLQSGMMMIYYSEDDDITEAKQLILQPGENFHVYRGLRHQMVALQPSELFEFSTEHFDSDSYRILKGD